MQKLLARALIATLVVGVPLAAWAQPPRPEAAVMKRIDSLKRDARRAFRVNKLDDAMSLFQQVLALQKSPDDELLFNLSFIAWEKKRCEQYLLYAAGFLYIAPGDEAAVEVKNKQQRCLKRTPNSATLGIESQRPKSVEIRLNDVVVGRTPIHGLVLAPQQYTVTANTPLFHPYEETVTLAERVETRHRVKMRKRVFKGDLEVTTEPAGATVFLDNVRVGKSPYTRKQLDTRRYLIRVEMNGWDRWVRYVAVEKNSKTRVDATLEKTGTHVPIPPLPPQDE